MLGSDGFFKEGRQLLYIPSMNEFVKYMSQCTLCLVSIHLPVIEDSYLSRIQFSSWEWENFQKVVPFPVVVRHFFSLVVRHTFVAVKESICKARVTGFLFQQVALFPVVQFILYFFPVVVCHTVFLSPLQFIIHFFLCFVAHTVFLSPLQFILYFFLCCSSSVFVVVHHTVFAAVIHPHPPSASASAFAHLHAN